mmetsp:Transcript_39017/g.76747  ORF Transcript_39017/g.76747 Transcript_39017/m.76747 type:complete len:86 (+) Transcript_39017:647-904(+)
MASGRERNGRSETEANKREVMRHEKKAAKQFTTENEETEESSQSILTVRIDGNYGWTCGCMCIDVFTFCIEYTHLLIGQRGVERR